MKKNRTILIVSCLILVAYLVFVACGTTSTPSSVVRKLISAIENGDHKTIEELMTPQAAGVVISMGDKLRDGITENGKVLRTEETITGDTAKVKVFYENGETADFDLIRDKGKWLVTVEK
jgi:hypothetical protein